MMGGLRHAVVIDADVSRKVGGYTKKRIISRRDPRAFLLGLFDTPEPFIC